MFETVTMAEERIQFGEPSAEAMRYVRHYVQRDVRLGNSTLAIPVLARAWCLLDFELGDAIGVHSSRTGLNDNAETAALVGLETYVQNRLLLKGNFQHFQIHFKPLALNHLFGLPVSELTNCNHAAHGVLGPAVSQLRQRIGEVHTIQERVHLADRFIAAHGSKAPAHDPMENAANQILRHAGRCRMDSLAHHTGFSMRNFQRVFQERVGVSPKLFSRIVRFEAALKLKSAIPQSSWANIAQECGFYDQMHLIHDFREFSGETPTGILVEARPAFELDTRFSPLS
jgi:AraC-like DNA-binding protein